VVTTPPNWKVKRERWEIVPRVRRGSCFGVGVGVDGNREGRQKQGGTNTVVDRTDSVTMIIVNNNVLRTVHIWVVASLDWGSSWPFHVSKYHSQSSQVQN